MKRMKKKRVSVQKLTKFRFEHGHAQTKHRQCTRQCTRQCCTPSTGSAQTKHGHAQTKHGRAQIFEPGSTGSAPGSAAHFGQSTVVLRPSTGSAQTKPGSAPTAYFDPSTTVLGLSTTVLFQPRDGNRDLAKKGNCKVSGQESQYCSYEHYLEHGRAPGSAHLQNCIKSLIFIHFGLWRVGSHFHSKPTIFKYFWSPWKPQKIQESSILLLACQWFVYQQFLIMFLSNLVIFVVVFVSLMG